MKTRFALTVALLMAVSGAGWALPAVTLDTDACPQTLAFDGGGEGFMVVLGMLELPVPDSWAVADFDQDGVADQCALYLLAEAICAGETAIGDQLQANTDAFNTVSTDFGATLVSGAALVTEMRVTVPAALAPLITVCNGVPALATYGAVLQAASDEFVATGTALNTDLLKFGQYNVLLADMMPWLAAMAGLGTESQTFIVGFLGGLLGDVADAGDEMIAGAAAIAEQATLIPDSQTALQVLLTGLYAQAYAAANPPMTVEEAIPFVAAAAAADAATYWPALSATAVPAHNAVVLLGTNMDALGDALKLITVPNDIAIYGVSGKTASEPFSGAGDYNSNGDTNAFVFQAVGGDPAAFVAAASGENPWYPGSASLPAVGLIGLAFLTGVTALGGALSLRKK